MPPKGYVFKTIKQRFLEKIKVLPNGCWQWIAFKDKAGYGRLQEGGREGKVLYAHRWAYEHYRGAIPEGLDLDHLCRNRWCVNPYHLEPVPRKTNIQRSSPQQIYGTCRRGHILNEGNIYWRKDRPGHWECRQCRRERRARQRNN